MATNYPGSLDSYSTKNASDTIAEGHINDPQDAIEAIEAKVGTGSSTAADAKVLCGTGAGASAWEQVNLADSVTGLLPAANLTSDIRIKGWVQFTGTGTVTVNDSYNVDSITDGGTGVYTVVWDTDFANDDYAVVATASVSTTGAINIGGPISPAVGSSLFHTRNITGNEDLTDATLVSVIAIGDQ